MKTEISDFEKGILREIGYFYLTKNDGDYSKCYQEIKTLGINGIEVVKDSRDMEIKISILLERPGLLIGEAGKNIESLNLCLKERFENKIIIKLHEDRIKDYLYPVDMCNEDF
jgi:predicted RNA-binding protein Jag